jgi:hypothetical protein
MALKMAAFERQARDLAGSKNVVRQARDSLTAGSKNQKLL